MQQKTLVVPGNCTVVCARWDILDQQQWQLAHTRTIIYICRNVELYFIEVHNVDIEC